MKLLSLGILMALVAFLPACQQEIRLDRDETTAIHNLLDQNRYEEALYHAQRLIRENPANAEYRILLASVYSARAGIRAPDLTPLFQAGLQFNAQLRDYRTPEPRPPISESAEELGDYITFIFRTIESVHTLFESVPLLTKAQIPDILLALEVMSYQRSLNADQAVYRAFLRVIYAKYYIENYLYSGNFITQATGLDSCDINLRDAVGSFRTAANIVADLLVDLAVAWPSSAEVMLNVTFNLQTLGFQLEDYLSKAQWVDNAFQRFLRRQIIQFSFAGLLICP